MEKASPRKRQALGLAPGLYGYERLVVMSAHVFEASVGQTAIVRCAALLIGTYCFF